MSCQVHVVLSAVKIDDFVSVLTSLQRIITTVAEIQRPFLGAALSPPNNIEMTTSAFLEILEIRIKIRIKNSHKKKFIR